MVFTVCAVWPNFDIWDSRKPVNEEGIVGVGITFHMNIIGLFTFHVLKKRIFTSNAQKFGCFTELRTA